MLQVSHETAPARVPNLQRLGVGAGEEGEDDARSACPSDALGCTRDTIGRDSEAQWREPEQTSKPTASSDCSLQLDCMKPESLVIADQHAAVNTFSSLVLTARQLKGAGSTRRHRSSVVTVSSVTGSKS